MTKKTKSPRNKTIDISIEEGQHFLDRTISLSESLPLEDLVNKTIVGDTFEVLKYIPDESIDLIIVDPPYNLSKNYHGNKFNKRNNEDYERYTHDWLDLVIPLLKPNGTLYVCCDWGGSVRKNNHQKPYHMAERKRSRRKNELEERNGGYLVLYERE